MNTNVSLKHRRIVIIFGNMELGGAERQGLLLAKFLKDEQKADVEIWGLSEKPGVLCQMCDEAGIPWRCIPFHWGIRLRVKSFVTLIRELKKAKPDILVPYTTMPNVACALAWKLSPARLCVWNQADAGLLLTRGPLHRLAVRLTPCFISNSTGGKDFLVQTYGLDAARIEVIHNGVRLSPPLHNRHTWRERCGVSNDCFVSCMVANIHKYKDHHTLLHAWSRVLELLKGSGRLPVLLLAGRFDEGGDELRQLATQLGIAEQVKFLGKVDDVPGLLNAVDLCIHSSKTEGVPNAVLEAMAAGLPVVGTDIPGIREAVGEAGERFLVPVGDHQKMADVIARLMDEPELHKHYGEALKKRIDEEFSLEQMCSRTARFLEDALMRCPADPSRG